MTLVLLLWLATAIASIFVLLPGLAPAYLCLFLLGFTPASPLLCNLLCPSDVEIQFDIGSK